MGHKHDHCEHELKYCGKCDVVWCAKCDREWGGHAHGWYYNAWPYWTYRTPYDTTSGNITISSDVGASSDNIYVATTTPHEHVCSQ